MSKGYTRGFFGAATLALGGLFFNASQQFEQLTPEEIAAKTVSPAERENRANIELALNEQRGPAYAAAKKKCDEGEIELANAKQTIPLATYVLEKGTGKEITFDMSKCVSEELNKEFYFARLSAPKGNEINNDYKSFMVDTGNNLAAGSGILGAALALWGIAGYRRQKASANTEPSPS